MVEGNAENFKELIKEGLVLVDFNAEWCGPCQMMRPVVEDLAEQNGEVTVVGVNIDDEPELAEEYGVETIPCLVMFVNGKEVRRAVGVMSPKKLVKLVEG